VRALDHRELSSDLMRLVSTLGQLQSPRLFSNHSFHSSNY